jgi:signal transduction histidine kinase
MTRARTRLVVLAALLCGAGVVALVATSDLEDAHPIWAIAGLAVGWSFIGTGLYARRRRPESRVGELMVVLGFAWFVGGLHFADSRLLYSLSLVAGGLWGGVFLHLVMSFPSGRLTTRVDRAIVVAGYLIFTVASVPVMLFAGPHELGCDDCPSNVLLIDRNADLARIALGFEALLYLALFVIVVVRLARRWRRAAPFDRLQLTPVYACGLLTFLLETASTAGGPTGAAAVVVTALLPFAFLAGLLRTHLAWMDAELRGRLDELRASRARLVEAGDTERRRIERDLHDGAQARIVGVALLITHTRRRLDTNPADPEIGGLLDRALTELRTSMAELRELARGIHPPMLTERGLEPALRALAGRAPVPVTVAADLGERLPGQVEIAAYYVVAEALANVAKYAQATEATVAVRRADGRVIVDIADDGIGGADPANGSGLRGLTDRVAALDGTLAVDSPVGAGTRLHVEIPWGSADDERPVHEGVDRAVVGVAPGLGSGHVGRRPGVD